MTGNNLERDKLVDDVMREAGVHDAPELKAALHSLGAFASMQAPEPGAELAALFAAPTDELSKRRWLRTHRPAVLGIAVVTAMGLGVSGVAAASSGFTKQPEFMNRLLAGWAPGWMSPPPSLQPPLPTSDAPKVTSVPAPTVDPAAVPPAEALTVPAAPIATAPAPEQRPAIPAVPAVPGGPGTPAKPATPAVPAAPQKDTAQVPKLPIASRTELKSGDVWRLLERDRQVAGTAPVNHTLEWWLKDSKHLRR
ncbi:hypothetical protein [Arthrobacter sp. CJ23]|uniref:hypothetical protein n=1 Tax=Arthrobacter sp. CJ23 TaxID=2972479 RepID=UPI00215CD1BF|nr:hypothetical protein [Arthrobacter sp. CJ23]UVJ40073.1 hypothetical protein NVV90_02435 [Arthrobacter sp. CJ23]